jgi:hypothetical protein
MVMVGVGWRQRQAAAVCEGGKKGSTTHRLGEEDVGDDGSSATPMVTIILRDVIIFMLPQRYSEVYAGCDRPRRIPRPRRMKRRKESSSYRGRKRKVAVGDNEGDGSDGADEWQNNRFIIVIVRNILFIIIISTNYICRVITVTLVTQVTKVCT